MTPRLESILRAFDKLSRREQFMVAGCALAVIVYGIQLLVLGPMDQRRTELRRGIEQQRATLAREAGQIAALEGQARDADSALKARIERAKADLARQDAEFRDIEARLVPPKEMAALLRGLLASRPGLRLVSLRTLPPQPAGSLSASGAASPVVSGAKPIDPAKAAPVAGSGGAEGYYRHGVELSMQGSFADLLGYVEALERLPQKLLWQDLQFKVEEYPRSTLTLVLYTLSPEPTWMQM